MDQELIRRWNKKVTNKDTVYFLGDFCFSSRDVDILKYLKQLNGRIEFIYGNHDENSHMKKFFPNLQRLVRIKYNKQYIVLCHYKIDSWQGKYRKVKPSWHLYGDSHGLAPDTISDLSMDIGVDCNNFYPLTFNEVGYIMQKKMETQQYVNERSTYRQSNTPPREGA